MIPAEPRIDSSMGVTRMNDRTRTPGEPPTEPSRHGPWPGADEQVRATEPIEAHPALAGEQLLLVRPVAHLRSPLFDEPAPLPPRPGTGARLPALDVVRAVLPYLVPVIAIGLPFLAIAGGDWLWVVIGFAVASIALHELAQRVTFTFAEGFLAFRNRDEWPHGVQEEYDVHYAWPSTGSAAPGA